MYAALVLRNLNKAGQASIYAEYSANKKVFRAPTGLKVEKRFWDADNETIKAGGSLSIKKDNAHAHAVREKVDSVIRAYVQANNTTPSVVYVRSQYEAVAVAAKEAEKTIFLFLDEWVEAQRATIKPNSMKAVTSLKTVLVEFCEAKKIQPTFADWNLKQFESFAAYLQSKDYNNTTTAKRIKTLKSFLNYYFKRGVHKNNLFQSYSYVTVKAQDKEVVTVTIEELEALKQLELGPRLAYVRDLFIIQCWTGLRYCDLIRLKPQHVKGGRIKIDMLKTSDFVNIPVLAEAKAVLGKYPDGLRPLSNVNYNKYLKELCELLPEMHEVIEDVYYVGKERREDKYKKYELITTHSARRSFCTLLMDLDINIPQIMRWSGHKDMRMFQVYINKKQGEAAAIEKIQERYSAAAKAAAVF